MLLRRLIALALTTGLMCAAAPALAQSEEDPEPEVSDAGPENTYERLLAVSATGGWDTPFGVVGAAIEFAPIQFINIYAGGGVSRAGGRFAFGVNFRAPVREAAFGLSFGLSGGAMDWDSNGAANVRVHRYWEFALFVNTTLNFEYRWEMGLFGRLSVGAEALVAGDVSECRVPTGTCATDHPGLSTPIYPSAGLSIGYAFEL